MTISLEKKLETRKERENLRQLTLPCVSKVDFASNDYLGLARSSLLEDKVMEEWQRLREQKQLLGSSGSRLLMGNSSYAEQIEKEIAAFHGYKTGTLFSSGYMANVGVIAAFSTPLDVVLFDACVHASLRNGIRLAKVHAFPFRHNDLFHLEERLQKNRGRKCFICVESLYSTDGSISPLKEICCLAKRYDAKVIVDEAHAVGIFGQRGEGSVFEKKLTEEVFAVVLTFGKALGVSGAIVLGDNFVQKSLVNFCHSYIYTTAQPFYALAAIRCSYAIFPTLTKERKQLRELSLFSTLSFSPIYSIPISGNAAISSLARYLAKEGFHVGALKSPTVRRGKERLRICMHAFNTKSELILLLQKIRSYWRLCEK